MAPGACTAGAAASACPGKRAARPFVQLHSSCPAQTPARGFVRHLCAGVQLAAGVEQVINGKTVRLNVAGPRPEQQMEPARHRGGAASSASPAPSGGPQGWPVGASLDPWPTAPAPQLWQQGGVPDLTSGIPGGSRPPARLCLLSFV